jgi:hypothetical protein
MYFINKFFDIKFSIYIGTSINYLKSLVMKKKRVRVRIGKKSCSTCD